MTYLSGPISGLPDLNRPAFAEAAKSLEALGHQVLNPHDIDHPVAEHWADYMRDDIIDMLHTCDSIALLPGWPQSNGAMVELNLAVALGMRVYVIGPKHELLDMTHT